MHTLAAINSTSHYIRSYENVQNVNVRFKTSVIVFQSKATTIKIITIIQKNIYTHGVESITVEEIKELG